MRSWLAGALVVLALAACSACTELVDGGISEVDAGPPPRPWAVGRPSRVEAIAADGAGRVYAISGGELHAFSPDGEPLFRRAGFGSGWDARHRLALLVLRDVDRLVPPDR